MFTLFYQAITRYRSLNFVELQKTSSVVGGILILSAYKRLKSVYKPPIYREIGGLFSTKHRNTEGINFNRPTPVYREIGGLLSSKHRNTEGINFNRPTSCLPKNRGWESRSYYYFTRRIS